MKVRTSPADQSARPQWRRGHDYSNLQPAHEMSTHIDELKKIAMKSFNQHNPYIMSIFFQNQATSSAEKWNPSGYT